jgi:hypothetical protein
MSDVIVSAEAVEEVQPAETQLDVLDERFDRVVRRPGPCQGHQAIEDVREALSVPLRVPVVVMDAYASGTRSWSRCWPSSAAPLNTRPG